MTAVNLLADPDGEIRELTLQIDVQTSLSSSVDSGPLSRALIASGNVTQGTETPS
jgi:hypothetical protein